jgi:CBS domain-containing protein
MRVERVPIRTTTRLTPGGELRRDLSIYCPFKARTFAVEHCRKCEHLVSWADDAEAPGAHIVCEGEHPQESPEVRALAMHFGDRMTGKFEEIAARTPIGVVMETSFTIAHGDLEIAELRRHLGEKTGRVLPVVGEDGTLLGVVASDRLSTPPPPPSRPELHAFLAKLVPTTVREVMTAHVVAFPEAGRVRDALNAMLVERVRYLPVVSADGVVVGLVWDLDLLSWLAQAHRSVPPPPPPPPPEEMP